MVTTDADVLLVLLSSDAAIETTGTIATINIQKITVKVSKREIFFKMCVFIVSSLKILLHLHYSMKIR